jgi:DNA polymerase III epsilon subunit-like protein
MRACILDLETTGLNADFMGVILVGCVKPFDKPVMTFRRDRYPSWDKRSDDQRIAKDIYAELQKYDIWVAHNGVCYDVNFLRARLAKWNIQMLQPKIVDPVRIARRYFKISRNSLESFGRHHGIYGKTHVEPDIWNRAALDGDRKAMDYIVKHCVADVKLLEKLTDRVKYLVPKITSWGSDV